MGIQTKPSLTQPRHDDEILKEVDNIKV